MSRNLLIIIDPQNDFVDPKGSMYIPGSEEAINNISNWILDNKSMITDIVVTQDTHRSYHIGHSVYWKELPNNYSTISSVDFESGKYTTLNPSVSKTDLLNYLKKVEERGLKHTIWPEHCIAGSWGWCFPEILVRSLNLWSLSNNGKEYTILDKGYNSDSEMYSALSYADGTETDEGLAFLYHMYSLNLDNVYLMGFAKDYCVAETLKDLCDVEFLKGKINIIDNCMSSIDDNSENIKMYSDLSKKGIINIL